MIHHPTTWTLTTVLTSTLGLTKSNEMWVIQANYWVNMISTVLLTLIAMISCFFLVQNEIKKWRKKRKK